MLETDDAWYALASGKDLDEAADLAMGGMLKFLQNRLPLSKNDIISLLSITGNHEISQVVDPLKTVRMSIPKYILKTYKAEF
jgi:amidase